MKGKILLSIAALVAACSLLVSCSRRYAPSRDVRIGVISMLSGEHVRPTSSDMGRGVRLAVLNVNARGGLRVGRARHAVTVFEEDDRNSPEGAVEAARTLIYEDRVMALIGPQFSSNAIPVARLAEQQRIVMVCPMSTHPDTTAGKRFVFRIPYVDTFQGAVLARFAREVLRAQNAAVLYDVAAAYNRTLADVFERTFTSLGEIGRAHV
jgi:branched-chain amino acid transport system substrate-binding protein